MEYDLQRRQGADGELLRRLLAGACELDERLLEGLLAQGVSSEVAVRRATRGWWHGGAALLLGGAIAFGAPGLASAHPSAAAPAARGALTEGVAAPATIDLSAPEALASLELVAGTALVLPAIDANGAALPPQQTPGTYYVVQAGDNLSAIAQRAYGQGGLWRIIYDANVSAIANANLISPGQRLYIPPLNQVPGGVNPGPTPGTNPQGASGQYVVQSGDTLSSIALRAYGNASLWYLIYNANTNIIANPSLIYPGQTISIPPQTPGGVGPGGQGPGQYTVRAGDNLWSIAQAVYGSPLRWSDIYNANRNLIGPNPGLIFSGTVLSIPS